jgi:hypothetical protein
MDSILLLGMGIGPDCQCLLWSARVSGHTPPPCIISLINGESMGILTIVRCSDMYKIESLVNGLNGQSIDSPTETHPCLLKS